MKQQSQSHIFAHSHLTKFELPHTPSSPLLATKITTKIIPQLFQTQFDAFFDRYRCVSHAECHLSTKVFRIGCTSHLDSTTCRFVGSQLPDPLSFCAKFILKKP